MTLNGVRGFESHPLRHYLVEARLRRGSSSGTRESGFLNFIFAFLYNFIMIVMVILFGHERMGMTMGAVAHQASSLFVVLSSLRLLK